MPGHRERLPPQNAQFIQAGGPAAFAPGGIVRGGSHRSSPAPPPPSSRSASTGGKGWPRSQPSTENEPEVEKVAIVAEEVGSRRSLAVHPSRLEAVAGVVVAARQPLGPPASPPPILTINGSTTSTTTSTSQSQWEAPPKVSSHTRSASINYSHVASTLKPEKPPSPWNTYKYEESNTIVPAESWAWGRSAFSAGRKFAPPPPARGYPEEAAARDTTSSQTTPAPAPSAAPPSRVWGNPSVSSATPPHQTPVVSAPRPPIPASFLKPPPAPRSATSSQTLAPKTEHRPIIAPVAKVQNGTVPFESLSSSSASSPIDNLRPVSAEEVRSALLNGTLNSYPPPKSSPPSPTLGRSVLTGSARDEIEALMKKLKSEREKNEELAAKLKANEALEAKHREAAAEAERYRNLYLKERQASEAASVSKPPVQKETTPSTTAPKLHRDKALQDLIEAERQRQRLAAQAAAAPATREWDQGKMLNKIVVARLGLLEL